MKLLVFSAKPYEIPYLDASNKGRHQVTYTEDALNTDTALQAVGFKAISIFSGDDAAAVVLEKLWDLGVRFIVIRSAGHNNIRLKAAKYFGFRVANAPEYSPHAVAEHAVALLLAHIRKIVLADKQVRSYNFSQQGLIGFNLHGKTIGIIGTGRIGSIMVKIMHGFGCKILANDPIPDNDLVELCNVDYVPLDKLCEKSDIISIHIPLTYENHYLINKKILGSMKKDVVLVNTSRGAVVDTKALLKALKNNEIAGYCTDVYEKEHGVFFKDNSEAGIKDVVLKELLALDNVSFTPHQAFMTIEALKNLADITFENINAFAEDKTCKNELGLEMVSS